MSDQERELAEEGQEESSSLEDIAGAPAEEEK